MESPTIRLFVSRWCVECERALALLEHSGHRYELIDVGDAEGCCRLHELTGGSSVPQATVDGRPIGGYRELAAFLGDGPSPAEGSVAAPIRRAATTDR